MRGEETPGHPLAECSHSRWGRLQNIYSQTQLNHPGHNTINWQLPSLYTCCSTSCQSRRISSLHLTNILMLWSPRCISRVGLGEHPSNCLRGSKRAHNAPRGPTLSPLSSAMQWQSGSPSPVWCYDILSPKLDVTPDKFPKVQWLLK